LPSNSTIASEGGALAVEPGVMTRGCGRAASWMRHGVPGGPALLDLTTLYRQAVTTQRARNRPLPQMRARNGGEQIPLVRNVAHQRSADDDEEPVTQPVRIPMPRSGDVLTPGDPADDAYGPVAVLMYDQQLGALGVRLGRPVPRSVNEVLRSPRLAAAIGRATVYDGGPVGGVILLVAQLRPDGPPIPGARALSGPLVTVPLAADPAVVAEAVERAWVFTGYYGWRPGQLEAELAQRAAVPSTESLLTWLTRKTAR